ncbi:hypothetical protein EVG20_g359 [Dentipellis fragilis]|uniref:SAGA-associated factor 11 n=1 Tax=Dentipellis fragilis TaxID=205917 RepID=A0A4Y9ZF80_9AGAM|nr:hypothetical protein EVG20_g359 [Dentipellis fragilis]
MAKSDREEVISSLASRIFSALVDDLVMDAALQSHKEVVRSRAVCEVCHTRCGQAHISGPSNANVTALSQNGASSSRQGTPIEGRASGTPGTSTPNGMKDGNLECVNCNRFVCTLSAILLESLADAAPPFLKIAPSRYAPHLSSCMGIGTGTRRGAARGVNSKAKPLDARSASPHMGSENGNVSDDSRQSHSQPVGKKKGRPQKTKQAEGEFNMNRKRPGSPQLSPNKNAKKQKTTGSPLSRVQSDRDASGTPLNGNTLGPPLTHSHSKIPSRLRESSTVSVLERAASSSTGSRSSSPGMLPVGAATPSSAHSVHSFGGPRRNGMVGKKSKPMTRLPSPPHPPRPPTPVMRRPETDYLVDVEGDETGSSTDTDSD